MQQTSFKFILTFIGSQWRERSSGTLRVKGGFLVTTRARNLNTLKLNNLLVSKYQIKVNCSNPGGWRPRRVQVICRIKSEDSSVYASDPWYGNRRNLQTAEKWERKLKFVSKITSKLRAALADVVFTPKRSTGNMARYFLLCRSCPMRRSSVFSVFSFRFSCLW